MGRRGLPLFHAGHDQGTFMNLKKTIVAGLAATALFASALPGSAQDATQAAPTPAAATAPATTPAPTDNWLKVCDPLPDGKKACIMRQVLIQNGTFLGSFLLRDDPGQESRLLAVAAVPLGVLLPFGLTWQIDSGKPIRVPFMLCDPQSCATQLVINEAYVNSLKKGNKLKLIAKNRANQDLVIEIDLAGFTAAYDNDSAMTFDQFTQQNTTSNALESVLNDRAEEMRRQLASEAGGDTAPSEGTTPATPPADGAAPTTTTTTAQ
jgi:invasion protein IalB